MASNSDLLELNGHKFIRADTLPRPWPCEVCGQPVWVGWLVCNNPDAGHREGERHFDVWESRPIPEWARQQGHTWSLDVHRCVKRRETSGG